MAVVLAPKSLEIARAIDPKQATLAAVGDLSNLQVFGENLFVATYIRPEKTAGGILRPSENVREDELQGNAALVLKAGDGFDEEAAKELLHQWVAIGYNDGLRCQYNGVACRWVHVDRVRGIYPDPSKVL